MKGRFNGQTIDGFPRSGLLFLFPLENKEIGYIYLVHNWYNLVQIGSISDLEGSLTSLLESLVNYPDSIKEIQIIEGLPQNFKAWGGD